MSFQLQRIEGYWIPVDDGLFRDWITQTRRLDFDRNLLDKIEPELGDGVVLDLGAHVGTHSIAYSRVVGLKNLIAFEPCSIAAECLKLNVRGINCIQAALSNRNEAVHLIYDKTNSGATRLFDNGEEVDSIRLDDHIDSFLYLTDKKQVSFIKMDIEGLEPKALDGMRQLIKTHKPKLLIEINAGALDRQGFTQEDLLSIISSFGYKEKFRVGDIDIQSDVLYEIT